MAYNNKQNPYHTASHKRPEMTNKKQFKQKPNGLIDVQNNKRKIDMVYSNKCRSEITRNYFRANNHKENINQITPII